MYGCNIHKLSLFHKRLKSQISQSGKDKADDVSARGSQQMPYSAYLYGDQALTRIHNLLCGNGQRVLVLGHSFDNCVIPFLALGVEYVDSIDRQGLIPKTRLYVHLSADYGTAVKVGQRHGRPVVYTVDSKRMQEDGYVFYRSVNGVWLTKEVPARYFKR